MYHVLLALGGEAMHGYGIMQAFAEKTPGEDALLPGTLYATIARMVDTDLIEELPDPGSSSSDKRRRYYCVTEFGRSVALAESDRIHWLPAVAPRAARARCRPDSVLTRRVRAAARSRSRGGRDTALRGRTADRLATGATGQAG